MIKTIRSFLSLNNVHLAKQGIRNFIFFFAKAPAEDQEKLKALWEKAGLGEFPTQEEN
jgi:hypothetical protein